MAITTESVDARSLKLLEEFEAHWKEVRTVHPELTDKLFVFAGWQSQKIAGLQEICLELTRWIACLTDLVLDEVDPTVYAASIADAMSEQVGTVELAWVESLSEEQE